MGVYDDKIQEAYLAYFNRPADYAGLNYWNTQAAAAGGTAPVLAAFAASAEYKALYAGMTSAKIVDTFYQNVFNRPAEPDALNYWGSRLDNGTFNVGNIVAAITSGAQNLDKTTVANKVAASKSFTAGLDTSAEILAYETQTTAGAQAVKDWLKAVTSDTATIPTAASVLAITNGLAATSSGSAGSTFTLTTGVDQGAAFTGGTANDTFTATSAGTANAANTLNSADSIAGGAGTDVLNITVSANDTNTLGSATISGIETVNVRSATAGQTATVDAAGAPGATLVTSNVGAGAVTVTNLATGAAIGVIGNGTVTNGAVTFGYATAAADVTLNLSGGTKVGTTVTNSAAAGTATVKATINSTGAANTVGALDLDGNTAADLATLVVNATTGLTATLVADDYVATGAALTVTGAGAVNLGVAGIFKTVDATTNSGGLTVGLATVTTSFKGSTGNDVVTNAATTATTAGMVDGGVGTDTLVLAADMTTTAEAAEYVNFETLRLKAGGTHAADLLAGITAIELQSGANAVTKLSATQAAAITALADITTGAFSLTTDTGASDVVTMVLGTGLTTSEATDTGALTLNGFETINLKANGGATSLTAAEKVSTIASFTADKATAINLTGQSFDLTNAAVTKAVTINGSALTGNLTLAGNLVAGSVVTATGTADALALGTAGSTYNAGAGDDAITATAVAQLNAGAVYNTIDGGAGTDTLTLTANDVVLVDDNFKSISNIEKIVVAAGGAAGGEAITTGGWFDAAFKTSGVTLELTTGIEAATITAATFTGALTLKDTATAATTQVHAITTGSGADTITLLAAGTTTAAHTINANAGNDTIAVTLGAVTTGSVTITGGAGQDVVTITGDALTAAAGANVVYVVAEGDSTLAAADSVTGMLLADGTDQGFSLNFDGSAAKNADVASTGVTGYTSAELTYAVTNGLITFAGTSAAALTAAQKATVAQTVITTADKAVAFTSGSDSYVFHNGATTDSLVKLVGVAVLGLDAVTTGYIDVQ